VALLEVEELVVRFKTSRGAIHALDVGYAILTMAALSFIGLGAQPPGRPSGAR
jgi:hypothetical protein